MAVLGKVVITPKGEYSNNVSYENLDCVFDGGSTWLAKQATKGNPPPTDGSESNDYWQLLARGVPIDTKDSTVTFEEATEDTELISGSKHSVLFGLIKKKLTDIVAALATKIDKISIVTTDTDKSTEKVVGANVTYSHDKRLDYEFKRIKNTAPVFIAHRGFQKMAPENTVPAFELAGKYGFKMFECDVQTTSDGYMVIMHDDTVDRTTNGTGLVSNLTLQEFKTLTIDTGSNIDLYPYLKPPTFEEAIKIAIKWDMGIFVHCKNVDINKVVLMLEKYGISNSCILGTSKNNTTIMRNNNKYYASAPGISVANILDLEGIKNVIAGTQNLTKDELETIHKLGYMASDYNSSNASGTRFAVPEAYYDMGIDFCLIDGALQSEVLR